VPRVEEANESRHRFEEALSVLLLVFLALFAKI
jgi:hypothetical protein